MYFVAHGHLEVRIYYESSTEAESAVYAEKTVQSMKASEIGGGSVHPTTTDQGHPNTMDLQNAWRCVSLFGTSDSYKKIGKLKKGEYFGEYSCLLGKTSFSCIMVICTVMQGSIEQRRLLPKITVSSIPFPVPISTPFSTKCRNWGENF